MTLETMAQIGDQCDQLASTPPAITGTPTPEIAG
jgi:hypothetical protein